MPGHRPWSQDIEPEPGQGEEKERVVQVRNVAYLDLCSILSALEVTPSVIHLRGFCLRWWVLSNISVLVLISCRPRSGI